MTEEIRWPELGCKPRENISAELDGHGGEILDHVSDFFVVHCYSCEFIHVIPTPPEDILADYYAREFYEKEKPSYIQRYNEDRVWWEMTHRRNIVAATEAFGRINGTTPSVLDVGTGPGIFLDVAAQFQWETWGIEPSRQCAQLAARRGHNIFMGTLEEFARETNKQFQFVHAYEVLEHVPNPLNFLEDMASVLLPHGVIGIVVPNDYNTLQLQAKEKLGIENRWWVAPPQHLNYFTPNALLNLIVKAGFEILEIRGTWPMESYLLAGYNYIGNDKIGRMCHKSRMKEEMDIEKAQLWKIQRRQLQYNILKGIGREIFVLARLAPEE